MVQDWGCKQHSTYFVVQVGQRVLLLQLELFLRSGLLLEEILDDVALLLYLLVDLLKVAEE